MQSRHQRIEDSEQYVRWAAARWMTREDLAVALTDHSGRLVGGSGLHGVDWRVRVMEIGYWLRTDAWGVGYASEAVSLLTALAFEVLDAPRVFIRCERDNVKSAAVPVRLGFTKDAHLRQARPAVDGSGLVDVFEFGLTQADRKQLPWYAEASQRVAAATLDG
jgi:RimJ/RimL family protein N-acetyltransferase